MKERVAEEHEREPQRCCRTLDVIESPAKKKRVGEGLTSRADQGAFVAAFQMAELAPDAVCARKAQVGRESAQDSAWASEQARRQEDRHQVQGARAARQRAPG